jgi:hypothetical protein
MLYKWMRDHLNAIFIAAFITKQNGIFKKLIIFIKYTYYVIKKTGIKDILIL